jgi:hypothetical protein
MINTLSEWETHVLFIKNGKMINAWREFENLTYCSFNCKNGELVLWENPTHKLVS